MEYVLKILNYAPEIVALKILNAALSAEYYLDDGGPNMFVILRSLKVVTTHLENESCII